MFAHPNFKIQTSPTKFSIITEKASNQKILRHKASFQMINFY